MAERVIREKNETLMRQALGHWDFRLKVHFTSGECLHPKVIPNLQLTYEPRHNKGCLRGFQPCTTQTELYNRRRLLEASNFGFRNSVVVLSI